ncbi:serine/threonine-protein kinase [Luteimonas sp. RIT-PG2_3]
MNGSEDPDSTQLLATRSPSGRGDAGEAGDAIAPGTRLGRYRIGELLGRGGMGEVYRADQLEPVRRTVAIKIMRNRRLDARHLAYFEVERQLLAQMRHPAIAQIFDADSTPEGYPFFAMEFIAGTPLTRYCEAHGLSLRERLGLFIRVCEGVQHAHQKGVIHRDLKPGNLLVDDVDGQPAPKIIDFGIATASSALEGREIAGTPEYMSPEQADGDKSLIDTRSDVYSLGVVLFELITGQRPAMAGETLAGARQSLRLPSAALETLPPEQARQVARVQGYPLAGMRRLLRGELDWVVSRAMAHERAARYPSAAALAEDLQRFLDGDVVQAVPPGRRYLWGRFVHRHRGALVAASMVLVALLGGLAMSVYGLMQAREQRAIAEARSMELGKVAAFQQSMLESIDIEAMGLDLADGLRAQIGEAMPEALPAFEQALVHASAADLARGLVDDNILAGAEHAIARNFSDEPALATDLRESVASVREALGLHAAAAAGFGVVADERGKRLGDADAQTLHARSLQISALLAAREAAAAMVLIERVLPQAARLGKGDPRRVELYFSQAQAIAELGDWPRARERLEALHADSVRHLGEANVLTSRIAMAHARLIAKMGEPGTARQMVEALAQSQIAELGKEDPATLDTLSTLAMLRAMSRDHDASVSLQQELVAIQTRRLGAEHPATLAQRINLGNMLTDAGRNDEALPVLESAVKAMVRVRGPQHAQTLRAQLNLSSTYARMQQFDRAIPLQEQVAQVRTRLLGPRHPDTLFIQLNRPMTLSQAGRPHEALDLVAQMLPVALEVLGGQHPQVHGALKFQAADAQAVGDNALMIASSRQLLALQEQFKGVDDPDTVDTALLLETRLRGLRQVAEADAVHQRYVTALLSRDLATLSEDQRELVADIRADAKKR